MRVIIIIEKSKDGQLGRCGFQIEGRNKKHLKVYVPKIEKPEATKEELFIMHSIMQTVLYARKNLKRLKYILFKLPNIPAKSKEWKVMSEFNKKILPKIRINYAKA